MRNFSLTAASTAAVANIAQSGVPDDLTAAVPTILTSILTGIVFPLILKWIGNIKFKKKGGTNG